MFLFCECLIKPDFDVETEYIANKRTNRAFQRYVCRTEMLSIFPHTNRKHIAVGVPMAFPIVKMENKNSQTVLFRSDYVDPHLIQQCLGPPQAPPETAAPTVEALSHTDAVNSPLVTMARPKFAPKVPLSVDRLPNASTCIIRSQYSVPLPGWSKNNTVLKETTLQRNAI